MKRGWQHPFLLSSFIEQEEEGEANEKREKRLATLDWQERVSKERVGGAKSRRHYLSIIIMRVKQGQKSLVNRMFKKRLPRLVKSPPLYITF